MNKKYILLLVASLIGCTTTAQNDHGFFYQVTQEMIVNTGTEVATHYCVNFFDWLVFKRLTSLKDALTFYFSPAQQALKKLEIAKAYETVCHNNVQLAHQYQLKQTRDEKEIQETLLIQRQRGLKRTLHSLYQYPHYDPLTLLRIKEYEHDLSELFLRQRKHCSPKNQKTIEKIDKKIKKMSALFEFKQQVARDPYHPVHQHMQPAVKMPLLAALYPPALRARIEQEQRKRQDENKMVWKQALQPQTFASAGIPSFEHTEDDQPHIPSASSSEPFKDEFA